MLRRDRNYKVSLSRKRVLSLLPLSYVTKEMCAVLEEAGIGFQLRKGKFEVAPSLGYLSPHHGTPVKRRGLHTERPPPPSQNIGQHLAFYVHLHTHARTHQVHCPPLP